MLRLIREFFAADAALRKTRARLAAAVEENSAGTRRIVGRPRTDDERRERARAEFEKRMRTAGAAE